MRVTAIVVARAGSRRLPRKALLPFAGTTLIGWAVDRLRACEKVADVVVGSDCDLILSEARAHAAKTIKRDEYHCDEDRCTANEMIADMVSKVDTDLVLWAHPTNPLVRPQTYDDAIDVYMHAARDGYDSLASVTSIRRHAWVDGRPWNYDPWAERHVVAAQLQPVKFQDGAIFIQPVEQMRQNSYFFGANPVLFEVDPIEGWDIDTHQDYEAAMRLLGVVQ